MRRRDRRAAARADRGSHTPRRNGAPVFAFGAGGARPGLRPAAVGPCARARPRARRSRRGARQIHLGPQRGTHRGDRRDIASEATRRMSIRRVAYVVNTFPKLSEPFIANELAELRRRGVEVLILSLRPPTEGLRHEIVAEAALLQRTVDDPASFSAALRKIAPDIVHAHFPTEPAAAARELAADVPGPLPVTTHGHDTYRPAPPGIAP